MRGKTQIALNMPDAPTWNAAARPTIACIIPAWSFSSSLLGWGTWSSQRTTGSSLCLSSFWFSMSSLRTSSCSTCLLHWWGKRWAKLHRRARAYGNSRYVDSVRLLSKKEGLGNRKGFWRESLGTDMFLNNRSLLLSGSPEQFPQKCISSFSIHIWYLAWADVPSVPQMFRI